MKDLKAIRFFYDGKKKVSHDYEGKAVHTYSYREMFEKNVECVGIPAKQNNFVIIDIDVPEGTHKFDGRPWWTKFAQDNDIPPTYTVGTPTGGMHLYYRLPDYINPETFSPPGQLAPGVDVKWNGWVGAPPTAGYQVLNGSLSQIVDAPEELLDEMHRIKGGESREYEVSYEEGMSLELPRPFTDAQLKDLRSKLEWMQTNGDLSYSEWRDGIFALKAGVEDQDVLEELVDMWTYNRSYQAGDEHDARKIMEGANKYGGVGPGTIFAIIKEVAMRQGATAPTVELSPQEVIDRSGVHITVKEDGSINCAQSETNAAALIGAMFPPDILYYDARIEACIYKGETITDKDLINTITPMIQSRRHGLGFDKIKKYVISGGIEVLMNARRKDPHVDWLKSLEWDGVERIDTFFSHYVGSDDNEYTRAVSKNFWIAMAARALCNGVKFDHIIVLEGTEGIRKSSLVEAIAGKYVFAPSTKRSFEDMDDLRKMHQAILVELPELMGLIGQDSNKVKAFLSKSYDNIRGLYERIAVRKERGFIFIGTTNDSRYLSYDMGARRFWPIKITRKGHININAVEMDREQLFAEAVHRFQKRESFYEVPEDMLKELVKGRVRVDPLHRAISEVVNDRESVSIDVVYSILNMGGTLVGGLTQANANRIRETLKILGFTEQDGGRWTKIKVDLNTFL